MSKKKRYQGRKKAIEHQYSTNNTIGRSVIAFGKPEPILTTGTEYQQIAYDNSHDYWQLPICRKALSDMPNLNAQHGGILYARRNMITADYLSGAFSAEQLDAAVFDLLLFGDIALLKVRNYFGQVIGLEPLPSLYLRLRKTGEFVLLQADEPLVFPPEDIIFLRQHDPKQQIYGLPDYIGGLHSALLNTEGTIFRRKYYYRGGTTGYILYTTDPHISVEVEQEIARKVEQDDGIGNFSNLYINVPKGDPEGVKVIPFSEVGAKDEFNNIKSVTSKDVLNAHRFPPGLAGIYAEGVNMPDPEKVRDTYRKDEVIPVQRKIANAINGDPEIPIHLHVNFGSLIE
ncbi:TPA: phage portal protein [Providencia rettgeri]|nr:phage portal protein [Providencia rettgeri]